MTIHSIDCVYRFMPQTVRYLVPANYSDHITLPPAAKPGEHWAVRLKVHQ